MSSLLLHFYVFVVLNPVLYWRRDPPLPLILCSLLPSHLIILLVWCSGWPHVENCPGVCANSPDAVASDASSKAYYDLLDSQCSYFKTNQVGGPIGWFAHIYSDNQEPEYGIYNSKGKLRVSEGEQIEREKRKTFDLLSFSYSSLSTDDRSVSFLLSFRLYSSPSSQKLPVKEPRSPFDNPIPLVSKADFSFQRTSSSHETASLKDSKSFI